MRTNKSDGITKVIELPPELVMVGLSIFSYFIHIVEEKYPDQSVDISIQQNDFMSRMTIKSPEIETGFFEQKIEKYSLLITNKSDKNVASNNRISVEEFNLQINIMAQGIFSPPLLPIEEFSSEALIEIRGAISAKLIEYLKRNPKFLYQIYPRQFEELIAEILASFGWKVQLTASTKDGGYDIFAISQDNESGLETSWLVECKKYASHRKVGVEIIRALNGINIEKRAANIMLATTSYFTEGVNKMKTSHYNLSLRDYGGILDWINTYRPNPNGCLYLKENKLILPTGP